MKITQRARDEFEFFCDTPLDMIGRIIGVQPSSDPEGVSALECWYSADTHGKKLPCREAGLLQKVLRGKKSWNLQVKLWAEDIADGLLRQPELVDYCHDKPAWIFEAVMAQAHLTALQKLVGSPNAQFNPGYEKMKLGPRFARAEYLRRNLWFPEMDAFDPMI